MIKDILNVLINSIKIKMPEFTKGVALAIIDDEGRVLLQNDDSNEYVYSGIGDNVINWFYIRHRDNGEIRFEDLPNNKQFVSCSQTANVSVFELRVVCCVKNWCRYELENRLRNAITSTQLGDFTIGNQMIKNVQFKPVRSQVDSIAVLKTETDKPKQFDKNLIFVAIDFDLSLTNFYI